MGNDEDACDFTALGVPVKEDGSQVGDTEPDCDVDLVDYARFEVCLSSGGPGTTPPTGCLPLFDFDADDNIDLTDFAAFQNALTDP